MNLDARLQVLEHKLRDNPQNQLALKRLIKTLNFHVPQGRPHGIITECQQVLISEFGMDGLFKFGADLDSLSENYQRCESILKAMRINIQISLSQIGVGNQLIIGGTPTICQSRLKFFGETRAITELCHSCYKVQILPTSFRDYVKTYFMLLELELPRDNHRKCMIELREPVVNPYKAYIYCESENEAAEIREYCVKKLAEKGIEKYRCAITHGCSEFGLEYPEFKYSADGKHREFKTPQEWHKLETDFFENNPLPKVPSKMQRKYYVSLNWIIAFRNWIIYAKVIGDQTYLEFAKDPVDEESSPIYNITRAQSDRRARELAELKGSL